MNKKTKPTKVPQAAYNPPAAHGTSTDNLDELLILYRNKNFSVGDFCFWSVMMMSVILCVHVITSERALTSTVVTFLSLVLAVSSQCCRIRRIGKTEHLRPVLEMRANGLRINEVLLPWHEIKEAMAYRGMVGVVLTRKLSESEVVPLVFQLADSFTILKLLILRQFGHFVATINIPQRNLQLGGAEVAEQINLRRARALELHATERLRLEQPNAQLVIDQNEP